MRDCLGADEAEFHGDAKAFPGLDEVLSAAGVTGRQLGTFAALDQRIALRYAMTGMTAAETSSYLSHHLKLAGRH